MSDYAIKAKGIKKSFGGVHALRGVDLNVKKAHIHAIVGENGAGKSTLMKILSGAYTRDHGKVEIFGSEEVLGSPKESQRLGIGIIYQEFALVPELTVAENIFLKDLKKGSSIINWNNLFTAAQEILDKFNFGLDAHTKVGTLSVAWQQMVEITKALSKNAKILILDEPTAVLAGPEVDMLFEILDSLRRSGVTILYISHRLEEIFRIADSITVIKDGQTVTELNPEGLTDNDIIKHMIGRDLGSLFPERHAEIGPEVLRVENLSDNKDFNNVSFSLKAGEVLGMAGLVGAGRSEVAKAIFGVTPHAGKIILNGKEVNFKSPRQAINAGVGLVPENRKEEGVILSMSIAENTTMACMKKILTNYGGVIKRKVETDSVRMFKDKLAIRMGGQELPVQSLSGGNQQKVVLAKWIFTDCKVLILDEPTRGVDVGAKVEIYNLINELAAEGYALLVISSELIELIGLCDRIAVMSEGTITGEVAGEDMTEEKIMRLAIHKKYREGESN